jgi:hypothetical protein
VDLTDRPLLHFPSSSAEHNRSLVYAARTAGRRGGSASALGRLGLVLYRTGDLSFSQAIRPIGSSLSFSYWRRWAGGGRRQGRAPSAGPLPSRSRRRRRPPSFRLPVRIPFFFSFLRFYWNENYGLVGQVDSRLGM